MTIHITPDSLDYTKMRHAHNVYGSNKLLELLCKHHPEYATDIPAFLPAPKPAPVVRVAPVVAPTPALPLEPEQQPHPEPSFVYGPKHYIHIQRVVAKHYGISRLDLIGQSRRQKYARPRQVAMYLAHDGKRTLPEIGRRFGGRDHTTVLYAVRKIERWVEQDLFDMPATLAMLRAELAQ